MKYVFVDTSAWYALVDKKDADHSRAAEWLKANTLPLFTTNYIFSETLTLIRRKVGHQEAVAVGRKILESNSLRFYRVSEEEEKTAWGYFIRHADKVYSFTDCVSFVVMTKLKIKEAFSIDRDFKQSGFRVFPEE